MRDWKPRRCYWTTHVPPSTPPYTSRRTDRTKCTHLLRVCIDFTTCCCDGGVADDSSATIATSQPARCRPYPTSVNPRSTLPSTESLSTCCFYFIYSFLFLFIYFYFIFPSRHIWLKTADHTTFPLPSPTLFYNDQLDQLTQPCDRTHCTIPQHCDHINLPYSTKKMYSAVSKMKGHFAAAQEELRKDVERAFGVLLSLLYILKTLFIL